MLFRILMLSAFLLLFTLSCATDSKPDAAPASGSRTIAPQVPDRPAADRYLDSYGVYPVFAYFHCGDQIYPADNYKFGKGVQPLLEGWLFKTIIEEAQMTFFPPHPILKKDIELQIPDPVINIRNHQREIHAAFLINGTPVLEEVYRKGIQPLISLKIPARLNQSASMTLTIRFKKLYSQAELTGNKDMRKLGIGIRLPKDDPTLKKLEISRAVFLVDQISPPGPDGIQKAALQLLDQSYGPGLPENLSLDLYPAAIAPEDPVKRYQPGDRLELILLNRPGQPPLTLYGGAASFPDPSFLPAEKSRAIDNPPLPEKVIKTQKDQIGKDLPEIRRRVKNRTRDLAAEERFQRIWIQTQNELQLIPAVFSLDNGQEIERFQDQFYWGVRHDSFFALPRKFTFMEQQSVSGNISALLAFRDLLQKNHIQLIILLVPDAGQIAARALIPSFESSSSLSALQCAASLLEFGLEAVYTDDLVMAKIAIAERLFCYPDPRPEAALWRILAAAAADRLSRFGKDHFKETEANHYAERSGPTAFGKNYRWPAGVDCGRHKNGEIVESLQVFRNGVPFRPDPKSAILVIGGENLNLPGPGHTFSGMFSKELHYSVDELVLPGKDWISPLPLVFLHQPYRYMSGKQAVILVISPNTLANSVMPDLKQIEAQKLPLKTQKPVHHFELQYQSDNIIEQVTSARNSGKSRETEQKKAWNHAVDRTPASGIRIREDSVPQDFLTLDIPEELRARPMTLVLHVATYPGQANTLTVNGHEVPLPVNLLRHHFRCIAVPLEAGTAKAAIKFSGQQGNLLMIRDVTLYQ